MCWYVCYVVKKIDLMSDFDKLVVEWVFFDKNGVLVDIVVCEMDMEIFDCGVGLLE